ncbi:hypothetical protein AA21952_0934 [Acetobacter oeni LMG 21952]|nr:hypothetical protein AA21952_0934 [Acetobacter oeni LMG 21952]
MPPWRTAQAETEFPHLDPGMKFIPDSVGVKALLMPQRQQSLKKSSAAPHNARVIPSYCGNCTIDRNTAEFRCRFARIR